MQLGKNINRVAAFACAAASGLAGVAQADDGDIIRYTITGSVSYVLAEDLPELPGVQDGDSVVTIIEVEDGPPHSSSESRAIWQGSIIFVSVSVGENTLTWEVFTRNQLDVTDDEEDSGRYEDRVLVNVGDLARDSHVQFILRTNLENSPPDAIVGLDSLPRSLDVAEFLPASMLVADMSTGSSRGFSTGIDSITAEVVSDDQDGDGLTDAVEADLAANGLPCLDPMNRDSDGDGLSDGDEVNGSPPTNPCDQDTDGDNIPDNIDPLPTDPEGTEGEIEADLRSLADAIEALPLEQFTGNGNSARGRRGALANQLNAAAKQVARGDVYVAMGHLDSILDKLDGEPSPADWIADDEGDDTTKADLAAEIELQLLILSYLL